ncbi:MAG: FtsX-like permease family protein [Candidatus Bathyarchaeota archaeon]|nr:FtsX-like permease family protein [Candidatus Termiticorpusculum sp.]
MSFVRRAFRSVFRRWARSILVIIVLCFIFALLISIPPSIVASRKTTQQTIDLLTANAKEINATVGLVATQINCKLPETTIFSSENDNKTMVVQPLMNVTQYTNNITSMPHVKSVFPVYEVEVNVSGFVFEVCGLPLDDASLFTVGSLLLPSNVVEGRNLELGDMGVVVLQRQVADFFEAEVGGVVGFLGGEFRVVGVEGFTAFNRTVVYVGLGDVWLLSGNVGNVTSVRVVVDDVANVEEVVSELSVGFSELSVSFSAGLVYSVLDVRSSTETQLELAQVSLSEIEGMGFVELGVVLVVACFLVLFVMLYTVRERTCEIGVLRALGASGWSVLGQFVFEGVFLCFVAGVFGLAVGGVGVSFFAGLLLPSPVVGGVGFLSLDGVVMGEVSSQVVSVGLTLDFVLFGLGIVVLLGVVGSLYPAWRASRIKPVEAMRYD